MTELRQPSRITRICELASQPTGTANATTRLTAIPAGVRNAYLKSQSGGYSRVRLTFRVPSSLGLDWAEFADALGSGEDEHPDRGRMATRSVLQCAQQVPVGVGAAHRPRPAKRDDHAE